MEKIQNLFKSPNFQKYASIAVLLIILAVIPITLSQVSSPKTTQTISQHAASGNFNQNICGVNIVNSDVSPQCHLLTAPQGSSCNVISTASNTTNGSYKTQISFRSYDGKAHTVIIAYWSFFCTNGGISPAPLCACNSSGTGPVQQTIQVPAGGSASPVVIQRSNDSPFQGQSCGAFQYDFIVKSVDGNQSCSSGSSSDNPAGWSICQTGINCGITPTSTPTPSDTPTPGITVTPTDTPVPSVTPTITPTNTPGPTATPNPSTTPTPTGNPTATPTNPPTVVTPTPKPTLPPTGPGNVFVTAGFVGIAVAVLGVAISLIGI